MAWTDIEIEGEYGRLKVGMVTGLTRDMLLGRDWVGAHKLLRLKEVLQGGCREQDDKNDFFKNTISLRIPQENRHVYGNKMIPQEVLKLAQEKFR